MRRRLGLALALAVLAATLPLRAQIVTSRRIDWSTAGATGGIQTRTTICTTVAAGASAATINAAIASCPAGQVIKLSAGTYTIGGLVIGKSQVTLRGAGPDQTFLLFTGADGCTGLPANICIKNPAGGPSSDSPGTVANWTAGYAKGATSITLSTVAGLAVGNMLVLDQLDDTNTDTGSVWVCQTADVCAPHSEGGAAGRSGRAQMQFVKVTGISGTTVTISPGLYMPNWRSGRSPQAWWIDPVTGVGIEDLSMDHSGSGTGAYTGMFWFDARDSWVQNVRSLRANRNHIWLYEDAHVTIRDSYFYGSQSVSSQAYGIETRMSSDMLVENNIFQHLATPMMNGNTNGTVWAYNYAIDDAYETPDTWQQASSYFHDAGVDNVLIEGNDGIGANADNLHGTSHFNTLFRNYWTGRDTGGPTKTQQTSAVILQNGNRFFNLLGNILGTSGYHTNYECFATSTTSACASANVSVYSLGFSGNEGSHLTIDGTIPNDVLVRDSSFRWGNYDPVHGAPQWNSSEVPTGLSDYPQTVPGDHVLPASLYRTTAPSYWGTVPWPAIGPDVTTGTLVSTHVAKIPARLCYETTPASGGILNFNASACYRGGGHRTKLSNVAATEAASRVCTLLNGGFLDLYTGPKPATADTAISTQTKLAGLTFAATACTSTTNGVATFAALGDDSDLDATGTAVWFRAFRSNHTTVVLDGSVCTTGCDLNVASTSLVIHGWLRVLTFTYTASKG